MILLDTHSLIWLIEGNPRLGSEALRMIEAAEAEAAVAVSAISFWEIALLLRKQRLVIGKGAAAWREAALGLGVIELPLDGATAIAAASLDLHPDPADRFILATAQARAATLVTADEQLLAWPGQVNRQDARL